MWALLLAIVVVGAAMVLVGGARRHLAPKPEPVRCDAHHCAPCHCACRRGAA